MNDKAVWSQSASYACMWYSNPPSLLPQREVSKLQKKGCVCACRFLKTKPATCLKVPTRLPCLNLGEEAHVNSKGRKKKIGVFSRAGCKKSPLISKEAQQTQLWWLSPLSHHAHVAASVACEPWAGCTLHFGQIFSRVRNPGNGKRNLNNSGSKNLSYKSQAREVGTSPWRSPSHEVPVLEKIAPENEDDFRQWH